MKILLLSLLLTALLLAATPMLVLYYHYRALRRAKRNIEAFLEKEESYINPTTAEEMHVFLRLMDLAEEQILWHRFLDPRNIVGKYRSIMEMRSLARRYTMIIAKYRFELKKVEEELKAKFMQMTSQ